jgi:hypothetical protein
MRLTVSAIVVLALAVPARCGDGSTPEPKVYRVPYRLTATNHVLLRAKINGKGPYNFILDTGAPALFVATAVGRKAGIKSDRDGWANLDRFEIEGGVVVKGAKARIEDPFQLEGMNGLGLAGVELHGMIGYNILARNKVTFDFTKNKMIWQPLDFNPPDPLRLGGASAPGGLDAIGSLMKIAGAFLGKKPQPEIVLRGYLGIALEEQGGKVLVSRVLADSPAALAGVEPGDQISSFQDKTVAAANDLSKGMARLRADETARLTVMRDGKSRTVEIKPGKGF